MPLLIPDGRKIRPTAIGQELAQALSQPLADIEQALCDAVTDGDEEHGTVRFGIPLTMDTGSLPSFIADFCQKHPEVRLHVRVAHGQALEAALKEGELDVAALLPAPSGLRSETLTPQAVVAVMPEHHRLARSQPIRLVELAEEKFIVLPTSYPLRAMMDQICEQAGFTPKAVAEVADFGLARQLVKAGVGIALIPEEDETADGLIEVPLDPPLSREVVLAWGPTAETPVVRRFAQALRSSFSHR